MKTLSPSNKKSQEASREDHIMCLEADFTEELITAIIKEDYNEAAKFGLNRDTCEVCKAYLQRPEHDGHFSLESNPADVYAGLLYAGYDSYVLNTICYAVGKTVRKEAGNYRTFYKQGSKGRTYLQTEKKVGKRQETV